jgi:hypothetical protein
MTKITIDRAVVEQALEALEALRLGMPDSVLARSLDLRIEALKAAMAESVQEPGFWGRVAARQASKIKQLETAAQQALEALEEVRFWHAKQKMAITALRAALAEPVQEPVAQALCEADRIMGHDDEATEWRQRWGHLFGVAGSATSPWRESAAQGCSPGGTGMSATPPQRPAEPDTDCHAQGICQRTGYGIGGQQ